ncbi:energy coupling factor transporter S component ThiW [Candidatus Korarchaeum cryptofilum]|jgi:energy coupling factor transporter S component ThiW|uniref:ThiW protein n=2 Tax=Candidatus Korarchaeum cryptofilum TaxID=498846 RepID=B1L585_KORCO|nr:energy coupling factor transporter S component ThiW [Candidatus Korarchaeum cryptofilum]ACB07614.1 thiW protein [Candidatus Korarchaeum cryptofilum OPF8]RSN69216.1 energy coupling factor transporter S component ThiW [Candidatus Korarchaeum cryptofilum]
MMRKLVTAGVLSALGVVISPLLSFPILAFKVYPGQHMINAISGVLLGPWWAALISIIVGTIRIAMGTGTIFAYPGGIPGALVVGFFSWLFRRLRVRKELAALSEPLGTVFIGGTIATLIVAPMVGRSILLTATWVTWAMSSVPGSIAGYLILEGLRRIGIEEI